MTPTALAQELYDNRITDPATHIICLAILEAIYQAEVSPALCDIGRLIGVFMEQHTGFRHLDQQHLFGLQLALTAQAYLMVNNESS